MSRLPPESVGMQLKALGIPEQGELEEITERLNGYVAYLEELRSLDLRGVYPMDTPPIPESPDE